jgi:DNA-binding NarL/FixJ family response regulator
MHYSVPTSATREGEEAEFGRRETIKIVVADDHPVTRAGTIDILRRDRKLEVVGETIDGEQTIDVCRALRPQLVLLDMRLPKMEGLLVANVLRETKLVSRILMFSAFADGALVRAALDAGADGYVLKSVSGSELINAVHRVMRGLRVCVGVSAQSVPEIRSLSARELMTLGYIAEGMSTKDIACQMSSSTRTIETYLNRIFVKLGASNRTQAVTIARREQLLPADQ